LIGPGRGILEADGPRAGSFTGSSPRTLTALRASPPTRG